MRGLIALVLIAAPVAGAVFFADRPGHVEIVWQGWQIDTSVGVLIGAVALVVLVVSLLVLLAAALRRVPGNLRRRRAARRHRSGQMALTRGVVALAAGQPSEARLAAGRAATLLDGAPMALLLEAEAATRQGDTAAARGAYTTLLEHSETAFLGLRGLIGQALRADDDATARDLAERARKLRPDAVWLVDTLLVLTARVGDWGAARKAIDSAARRRVLPAERARHHRGVVLYEMSLQAERRGDPRGAATLAAKAQALAADLAAPAAHNARLLVALGRQRAAAKAIERAWRTAPHPSLACLYLDLRPDAAPLARVAALQRLAAQNPEASESHLAIAEAALAAQLWGEARRHLALAIAAAAPRGPPRRLCRLMARLEENEAGNIAAARDWLDRAVGAPSDPCYVCARCGGQSWEWQALCRECGGFDTLLWQTLPDGERISAHSATAGALLVLPMPEEPGAGSDLRPLPPHSAASSLAPPPRWDK
jgi:HemY protein